MQTALKNHILLFYNDNFGLKKLTIKNLAAIATCRLHFIIKLKSYTAVIYDLCR
jgi:hypothetical protein